MRYAERKIYTGRITTSKHSHEAAHVGGASAAFLVADARIGLEDYMSRAQARPHTVS